MLAFEPTYLLCPVHDTGTVVGWASLRLLKSSLSRAHQDASSNEELSRCWATAAGEQLKQSRGKGLICSLRSGGVHLIGKSGETLERFL